MMIRVVLAFACFSSAFGWFSAKEETPLPPSNTPCGDKRFGCGVEFIVSKREASYSWRPNTHRAILALVTAGWFNKQPELERANMIAQLEAEVSKLVLRRSSQNLNRPSDLHTTRGVDFHELALYIEALIAVKSDPRDFYGVNLVSILEERVQSMTEIHPFLVLVLCYAGAVKQHHLGNIRRYVPHGYETRERLELKALTLQAYSCARDVGFTNLDEDLKTAANCLQANQTDDGSFGNVYTTSLIIQALVWSNSNGKWDETKALQSLRKKSMEVNLICSYYVVMAEHARNRIRPLQPLPEKRSKDYFVQYTLKIGDNPEFYLTMTIGVPRGSTFFEVMNMAAEKSVNFRFGYVMAQGYPEVFKISDVPNDVEDNKVWQLFYETAIDHDRHRSNITSIYTSPGRLVPDKDSHVVYWFKELQASSYS